jgi:hypothetical protein
MPTDGERLGLAEEDLTSMLLIIETGSWSKRLSAIDQGLKQGTGSAALVHVSDRHHLPLMIDLVVMQVLYMMVVAALQ